MFPTMLPLCFEAESECYLQGSATIRFGCFCPFVSGMAPEVHMCVTCHHM